MKILFFDTKSYDLESFKREQEKFSNLEINYIEAELDNNTINLCASYEAICIFVNCKIDNYMMEKLHDNGVKLILLRCSGYNNIDIKAAKKYNIRILRVPAYSPHAVAEMAMGLAIAVNRKIHKAYIKVRENNFALIGLTGINFYGKTAGIIGMGKIGQAMADICLGFGMNVIAYDKYQSKPYKNVKNVELTELLNDCDLISLHCPLTDETYHIINSDNISKMKDGVILVNTSRGGLIKTDDLIKGIRDKKFFGVALDVYEEEGDYVFENLEDDILEHSTSSRLLSFPNVIVTSHQGFLTREALEAISYTTLKNASDYIMGTINAKNEVLFNS